LKNNRKFWFSILILISVGLAISTVFAPVVQARDLETGLEKEHKAAPAKTAQAEVDKQQSQAQFAASLAQGGCNTSGWTGKSSCGYSGVSGDGNQLKIAGVYTDDVRYVYLQCGKKVGVLSPPTCSCSSGAYQYSCKRPPTVYITIPCH
jgi:hypothetical protein